MKKFLLLNFLGFFLLFNLAALVISCGKAKKAGAVKTTGDNNDPQKAELKEVNLHLIREAAKVISKQQDDEMPSDDELKNEWLPNVNEAIKSGEMKVESFTPEGLAKAIMTHQNAVVETMGNRIKCVSNLKNIGNSFLAFAADNNERMPWHLSDRDKTAQFGEADNKDLGNILAHPAIRADLVTPKILLSPCDPDRKEANEKLSENWDHFDPKFNPKKNPVPTDGVSYALCLGGDALNPTTVLALTRNVSGAVLKDATFKGGVMKGLKESQGQLGTTDGAALQLDNKGLAEKVKAHTDSRGGVVKGAPSTLLALPK